MQDECDVQKGKQTSSLHTPHRLSGRPQTWSLTPGPGSSSEARRLEQGHFRHVGVIKRQASSSRITSLMRPTLRLKRRRVACRASGVAWGSAKVVKDTAVHHRRILGQLSSKAALRLGDLKTVFYTDGNLLSAPVGLTEKTVPKTYAVLS